MADAWDARYRTEGWFYGTEPNEFLRDSVAQLPAGSAVLCLAEGEGRNAVYLAGLGHHVTAVDQSVVGLEKAARLAAEHGVAIDTVHADLAVYRIAPARWDAVVSIWCHLPPALRARVHRQVVEGLKPGGVLVLEAYTPAQLQHGTGGPPSAELMMTLADLQNELAGLDLVHGVEIERVVHEGRGHEGVSAVVQIVARKPRS